ncbi:DegT/DnrJ/EryC1/StrS family aminotransferase [Planctomycetota bacterium]
MEKLAIDGGNPVCEGLQWGRSLIGTEEKEAVHKLLEDSIANGKAFDRYGGEHVDAYEQEYAAFANTEYATAVSSGTAAVHTAISALRLEPGREIICAPITDPGAVAPVLMNLCIPVFADTAAGGFNMCAAGVEKVLSDKTAAIVVGHIAGEPADMDPILKLTAAQGLPVIEDCAQAHGAEDKGRPVGGMGTAGCFSLMSGKHHTAGGQGGMVVTNDRELYLNAKRFADRGKPFESESTTNLFMGINYRMTEFEAAVGRVQLKKLPGFVARRRELALRLADGIKDLEAVALPIGRPDSKPVFWFLRMLVDEDKLSVDKAQFGAALKAEGVPSAHTYTNIIYTQKWLKERNTYGTSQLPWTLPGAADYDYTDSCPNAEAANASHMLISFNESLSDEHMDKTAEAIRKVAAAYAR